MAKHYTMVVDMKRCIGCHACTIACKMENNLQDGSWISVHTVDSGRFPNVKRYYHPMLCNHCERPRCFEACGVGAIAKREDGIVLVDSNLCTGCLDCVQACPFNVMKFNNEKNTVEKCTLCVHRVDEGLEPFCAVCCPTRAISFGDINDIGSVVFKKAMDGKAFVLLPQYGVKPCVVYCHP